MENASKALMIAGGVLVALLVTTLLLGGLSRLRHYQNVEVAAKKNEQLASFNSQFESYNKQVISGYELISVGHMTTDTNNRYLQDEGYVPVAVYVDPKDDSENGSLGFFAKNSEKIENKYYNLLEFTEYFDKLSDYVQTQYNQKRKLKEAYFKCDSIKYDDKIDVSKGYNASGRVIEMRFSEMTKKKLD